MGWLLELARENDVATLGVLARRMLERWPAGRRKPRSDDGLRSALSKADRAEGLRWFEQPWRAELVDRVLGVPKGTTVARVRAQRGASTPTPGLVLHDLPSLPRINLSDVALPPGLPPVLGTPDRWEDEWWYAPSGSGRTLAGEWLRARGIADVVVARSMDEVTSALDGLRGRTHRPLYIEIPFPYRRWDERRRDIGSPLLVATAAFPPGGSPFRKGSVGLPLDSALEGHFGEGLWRLHTSTVAEHLAATVRWLAERTSSDVEVDRLVRWLEERTLGASRRHEFDFVVSVTACAHRFGVGRLEKLEHEREWLQLFLLHRLREARVEQANLLAELLVEQLVRGTRRLIESGSELLRPQSTEEWRELVANHDLPTPADVAKLFDALGRHKRVDPKLKAQIVREASDPRVSVDALGRAGLLVGAAGERALRPAWLGESLRHLALGAIAKDVPSAWGRALLAAPDPGPLALAIAERIANDSRVLGRAVRACRDDDADLVVALEVAFRAAGMITLIDPLPDALLRDLWDRQAALAVEGWRGLRQPRVPFPASEEYLLSDGAWFAAALAIARQLKTASGPFAWATLHADDEALRAALDHVDDALKTLSYDSHAGLLPKLFALGSAIASHINPRAKTQLGERPPELLVPAVIIRRAREGELGPGELSLMDRDHCDPERVREEAVRQGVPWDRFCRAVWHAWHAAGGLSSRFRAVGLETRWTRVLWAHLPRDVMRDAAVELVKHGVAQRRAVPFDVFSAETWSGLLDAYPRKAGVLALDDYEAVFLHVPEEHVVAAVRSDIVPAHSRAMRVFWRRFPEMMLSEARRRVDTAPIEDAASFVSAIPFDRADHFVERLVERLATEALDGPRRIALVEWARGAIRERARWRLGWVLLRALVQHGSAP